MRMNNTYDGMLNAMSSKGARERLDVIHDMRIAMRQCRKDWAKARSCYMPHQGAREKLRRQGQVLRRAAREAWLEGAEG
jgi:hypothetical protein